MKSSTSLRTDAVPLRAALKEFTRTRICDAARDLFFAHGYTAVTIEQIAQRAQTRRSTLYTHFRDKEEILLSLMEGYLRSVQELIAQLPGPSPKREEIDHWIGEFANLALQEKVPTVVLMETSTTRAADALGSFGDGMLIALAERLPTFRETQGIGLKAQMAKARAYAVLRQLGWALCQHVSNGPLAKEGLIVAGEWFDNFVNP